MSLTNCDAIGTGTKTIGESARIGRMCSRSTTLASRRCNGRSNQRCACLELMMRDGAGSEASLADARRTFQMITPASYRPFP